jgi:glucose/arabinose dehydrogenase
MKSRRYTPSMRRILSFAFSLLTLQSALAQPFPVQGPGVDTNNFRVTTFASGLDFPLGMAQLADGSLLVALSRGANFFSSTGTVVRLVDADGDGVADGPPSVVCSNLPGSQTSLRVGGHLVFVTGSGKPISILRTGATPADALTLAGQILIVYPPGAWLHQHSALGLRKTPGRTNSHDLVFQVGSSNNAEATTFTVTLTNASVPGANAELAADSVYMLTIEDHGTNVTATNLTQIASGLRNAAGFAFHPVTGDLYLQDNGMDGLVSPGEPLSADELNCIARTNIGGSVESFGFPGNYTAYRSNTLVGGAGIQPLVAFQPIPEPFAGRESEGPNDIAFAPPGFPDALNAGIFMGFHGRFSSGGTNNEENPLVYANPANGEYFHFIEGQQAGVGHLDGLLSTRDSIFVADFVSTGNVGAGAGAGVIYQIKSLVVPAPPELAAQTKESQAELIWDRGALREAEEVAGPWSEVVDAFSPFAIPPDAPQKFYSTSY